MFGQIPDFNDGLEFLRKMWGNAAGMPGMGAGLMPGLQAMTPPMNLEDVDKRIHDLKAVESWLQLNTNLLRTTIQGLEVQRATLVALKTFGNALSPEAMQSAMENVARAANAPTAARRPPSQPAPGAEGIDARDIADMAEMEATPDAPSDEGPAQAPGADEAPPREETGATQAGAPGGLPPQAGLWWDMVQRQFNQIASGAAAASLASLGNLGAFGAGAGAGANAAAAPTGSAGSSDAQTPGDTSSATGTGARVKSGARGAPGRATASAPARSGARAAAGRSGGNTGAADAPPRSGSPAGSSAPEAPVPRPRRTRAAPKT